jgi:hypothetical protein
MARIHFERGRRRQSFPEDGALSVGEEKKEANVGPAKPSYG